MTTVMPPEVRAYIDGIPPGHRPLFERRLRQAERPRRRLHLPPPRTGHQQGNPPAPAGDAAGISDEDFLGLARAALAP